MPHQFHISVVAQPTWAPKLNV